MPDPITPPPVPSSADAEGAESSAQTFSLRHGPSHARMWVVAVVGLTIDLWSKHWAFDNLRGLEIVVPKLLHLNRSLNPGALFGLGHGMTPVFIVASILALLFVIYLFAHTPRDRWSMHIALGMILAGALGNLYDRAFVEADAIWRPSTMGWRSWLGDEVYLTGKLVEEDERFWHFAEWPEGEGTRRRVPKRKAWHVEPSPVVRDFIKIDTSWLPRGYQLWRWIFNVADALLVVGVGLLLINFWLDRKHHRAASSAGTPSEQEAV